MLSNSGIVLLMRWFGLQYLPFGENHRQSMWMVGMRFKQAAWELLVGAAPVIVGDHTSANSIAFGAFVAR